MRNRIAPMPGREAPASIGTRAESQAGPTIAPKLLPGITVAICTCGRGDQVVATLESVLANACEPVEVLVIDQSRDERTAEAMARYRGHALVRYVRSGVPGLGRARNLALSRARTEWVAFTDDDCVVPADWLLRLEAVFAAHPEVALVFHDVQPEPHDLSVGLIPYWRARPARVAEHIVEKGLVCGMGAGMAMRRAAALGVGGFDPLLGAGGEFRSAEELDLMIRLLLSGQRVLETDAVTLVHRGFRSWDEYSALIQRDWTGFGAVYAKLLRAGRLTSLFALRDDLWRHVALPALRDLGSGRRPRGWIKVRSFQEGFRRAWGRPVNPHTLVFEDRPARDVLPVAGREQVPAPRS